MNTCLILGIGALVVLGRFSEGFLVSSTCGAYGKTNGCSIPFGLPYFYKDVFKPACDKHDICYVCGSHFSISRGTCDSQLWTDIKNICHSDSNVKNEAWCQSVTFDYYAAVRIGGSSYYESSSPSWCSQSWVLSCLY